MRHIEIKRSISQETAIGLAPDPLPYKYPLTYAKSGRNPDISLVVKDRFNEREIEPGIYHFNHVSCSCRSEKKDLLDRIRSVFKKKSLQTQASTFFCDLHSLNHDVLLESHNSFVNIKQNREAELALNLLCYHYPLNYAESERDSDLSLVITDASDENYIPPGIYHFKHISCSCPREKKGLLYRIQSIFKRKSSESWVPIAPCKLHSFNHDVLLQFYDLKKI